MNRRGAAQVLGYLGRLLVGAGVVILLFAAFQLWGTGLAEAQAQDDLADEFAARVLQAGADVVPPTTAPSTTSSVAGGEPTTAVPVTTALPRELVDLLYPAPGEPLARIVIPRIGVDKVVVEGIETEDLRKGPGHFPYTPLPGQAGNSAIAGHRTTYGAPFGDIDQLEVGDEIRVSTVLGESVYLVAGTQIVEPEQIEVVGDFGDNRLTLSACHPKFSAAQRIIVWALLQGEPTPTVPRPDDRVTVDLTPTTLPSATSLPAEAPTTTATTAAPVTTEAAPPSTVTPPEDHLGGDASAWPGAIGWGAAALVAAAAAMVLAVTLDRRRGERRLVRRLGIYALASPAVGLCLFLCFTNVDRLLPAY